MFILNTQKEEQEGVREKIEKREKAKGEDKARKRKIFKNYSEETWVKYYNISAYSATSLECKRETSMNCICRGSSFILNPVSWLHRSKTSD